MFPKPNPAQNTKKATGNCTKSGIFFFVHFSTCPVFTSPEDARLMQIIFTLPSFLAPCLSPRQCSILRSRHWEIQRLTKVQDAPEKNQDTSLTSCLHFLFWADKISPRSTHSCLGKAFLWSQAGPVKCGFSFPLSCSLTQPYCGKDDSCSQAASGGFKICMLKCPPSLCLYSLARL